MKQQTAWTSDNQNWKYIFIAISALILVIMPWLSHNYGQSGDEWLQIEYGQHIWNYFFNGDKQALDYTNKPLQYENMQLYGGLFDYYMEVLHHWLPSIPILYLRHFFNALMGGLMMIFTGLITYRLSQKKWLAATIALLLIVFSPRMFGESMNNPKDIPFACGFVIGVYSWLAIMQDITAKIWKHVFGLMVGFGIAFGVRPAGGLLMIAYFIAITALYYFFDENFKNSFKSDVRHLLKKLLPPILIAFILAYLIGLSAWPWGLQSPISNPITSLQEMSKRGVVLRVFFEGAFHPNNILPWYYELKWILISNPLIVILGVLLFFTFIFKAKKKYGIITISFILFAAFFPPLYMIYKKSTVYDTWRHLFFIYPFWVTIAALAINLIGDFINNPKLKWLPIGIAVIGLLPTIIWTFKSHPNQYVYFNELVGGIEGAAGYYDTDYYQNSGLQDAEWILKNVKPIPGKKIIVVSNMLGFDKYFAKDTSWLDTWYVRYNERHQKDWDYFVTYSRYISPEQLQNDKWPPANVVHEVKVNGVVLSAVIERKSKAGIEAYDSLQAKNFPAAAEKYAEYIKTDATDENVFVNYGIALASMGNIDGGISALKKATELDGGNPQYYQILSQLYQIKGDKVNAQQATNQANAIMMHEQELMQQDD